MWHCSIAALQRIQGEDDNWIESGDGDNNAVITVYRGVWFERFEMPGIVARTAWSPANTLASIEPSDGRGDTVFFVYCERDDRL